jgi:parvulin-like peptidyl-prolyl isomerase
VVARVGDQNITQAELDKLIAQQKAEAVSQGQAFPAEGTPGFEQARRQVLEQIRLDRIVSFESRKCGKPCTVTQAQLDARLEEIKQQSFGGSEQQFQAALKQAKISKADLQRLLRADRQRTALFNWVTKAVTFTEADAKTYYDEHPDLFKVPELRQARHILVANKAQAERIRATLTNANFAAAAKRYSTDTSNKNSGGELGPVQKGAFVPEFEKAVYELKNGEISQPVQTQFGWHLIGVTVTPGRTTPFEQAKAQIIQGQLQERKNARFSEWEKGVLDDWNDQTVYASDDLVPRATTNPTPPAVSTVPQPPASTVPAP